MHDVVIGSGPAAAAVVLALQDDPSRRITVLDIGERLEPDAAAAVGRMGDCDPSQWDPADAARITAQSARGESVLPEKRSFGSDYMFRDRGQQRGIAVPPSGNTAAVSGALGGFSNVWGAQVMPFSPATFSRWPVGWNEIEPHYRAVLAEVPLAADEDDYAADFPLMAARSPLPPSAPRTEAVLRRYERHRRQVQRRGVVVGRARLAFAARECVRCGLCMTGCPYELIYSARHTIDRFRASGRIEYIDGVLVTDVDQPPGQAPVVRGRDLATGRATVVHADRVFVAAGGLGSTRIVLNSLSAPPQRLDLQESMQFLVPFVSRRSTGDPRRAAAGNFTLNQFNILLKYDEDSYTTSQIHCYPYNPAVGEALPGILRRLDRPAGAVLGRVTAGLGYLPSWQSPKLTVELRGRSELTLPEIAVTAASDARPPMLRSVLRRLAALGPALDLYPVLPMVRASGPGKSYHFGGTFPHSTRERAGTSDLLGRVGGWRNIHLVDGSVLPSVPSTTFTLTVMANAHRIATASRDV
jgi:choline dehydrogenase-like flavoprotein